MRQLSPWVHFFCSRDVFYLAARFFLSLMFLPFPFPPFSLSPVSFSSGVGHFLMFIISFCFLLFVSYPFSVFHFVCFPIGIFVLRRCCIAGVVFA